jgi:hypothetical protein
LIIVDPFHPQPGMLQDTLADKEVLMSEELRAALNQYLVMRKDRWPWGDAVVDSSCGVQGWFEARFCGMRCHTYFEEFCHFLQTVHFSR